MILLHTPKKSFNINIFDVFERKVSLNCMLSDTFYIDKSEKVLYSVTFLIITSFHTGVNCIKLSFYF